MDNMIDWLIINFRSISFWLTISIFVVIIGFRLSTKDWKFKDIGWGLNDYVQALLSSYTIPTGLLIMICCRDVNKLAEATDVWLYLILAGGSLVYTSVSTIYQHVTRN